MCDSSSTSFGPPIITRCSTLSRRISTSCRWPSRLWASTSARRDWRALRAFRQPKPLAQKQPVEHHENQQHNGDDAHQNGELKAAVVAPQQILNPLHCRSPETTRSATPDPPCREGRTARGPAIRAVSLVNKTPQTWKLLSDAPAHRRRERTHNALGFTHCVAGRAIACFLGANHDQTPRIHAMRGGSGRPMTSDLAFLRGAAAWRRARPALVVATLLGVVALVVAVWLLPNPTGLRIASWALAFFAALGRVCADPGRAWRDRAFRRGPRIGDRRRNRQGQRRRHRRDRREGRDRFRQRGLSPPLRRQRKTICARSSACSPGRPKFPSRCTGSRKPPARARPATRNCG